MSPGIEETEEDTIQREKRKAREEQDEDTIQREKRIAKEQEEKKREMDEKSQRDTGVECRYLTLSTVTMLIVAGTGTLHMFSWLDVGVDDIELYEMKRETSWETYETFSCLMEADYIFWAWIGVYALQIIWILYGIVLIFHKTPSGTYLYTKVKLLPASIHIFMMLAGAATFGWVLVWNRFEEMRYAIICEGGATLFSFTALLCSMLACRSAEPWLVVQDKSSVLLLVGLFIQNGLAAFATMSSIMTNYHLSIILTLEANIKASVACFVSFGLLLSFMGVYFIIDTCLSDRHAQYVVTPYILACLAFAGAYFKIRDQSEDTIDNYDLLWILSLVGAGSVALMLLVKIIVAIIRAQNRRSHDLQVAKKKDELKPKV